MSLAKAAWIHAVLLCALLALALFDMPYWYYQVLRIACCVLLARMCMFSVEAGTSGWTWTFGVGALIYNPIFPMALGREVWSVVNVATIVVAVVGAVALGRRMKEEG